MANTEQFTESLRLERRGSGFWRFSTTVVKQDLDGDDERSLRVDVTMEFPRRDSPNLFAAEQVALKAALEVLSRHLSEQGQAPAEK